jgi:hypothetical protein
MAANSQASQKEIAAEMLSESDRNKNQGQTWEYTFLSEFHSDIVHRRSCIFVCNTERESIFSAHLINRSNSAIRAGQPGLGPTPNLFNESQEVTDI